MQLKKQFGRDFVHVMLSLDISDTGLEPLTDAATRFFLIMWDFSPTEVDEVFTSFYEVLSKKQLGDLRESFERLAGCVRDSRSETEKLIIQAIAIAYLNVQAMKDRPVFLEILRASFNLEPAEFEHLADQGSYYSVGLNYFGSIFSKLKTS